VQPDPSIRYTGSVTNAFVQSIARNFDDALRLMEAALSDCPDELWEASMWQVPAPDSGHQFLGPDWNPSQTPHTVAPWERDGYSDGRLLGAWRGTYSKASTTT